MPRKSKQRAKPREEVQDVGAYISTEKAAMILDCKPRLIRRLIKNGDLPGVKIGERDWRIKRSDFDAYLNRNKGAKPAEPA